MILTTKAAAARLDVSDQTFLNWAHAAGLEPVVQGNGITGAKFWQDTDVDALGEQHRRKDT